MIPVPRLTNAALRLRGAAVLGLSIDLLRWWAYNSLHIYYCAKLAHDFPREQLRVVLRPLECCKGGLVLCKQFTFWFNCLGRVC